MNEAASETLVAYPIATNDSPGRELSKLVKFDSARFSISAQITSNERWMDERCFRDSAHGTLG